MLPMRALRLQLGEALAADATLLAPAVNENLVRLIMANFAPEETLEPGDLEFATFVGSAALEAGLGTQLVGLDPATGEQIITIKEPVGGWRFEVTAGTNLPQTIYGYALLSAASADLLAVALLDEPVTLTEVGQEINLGTVKLTIVVQPMS